MDNRYFFDCEVKNNCVSLLGQEFIHLTKVRRAKIGDEIVGFNGDGFDYLLKISNVNKNSADCEILTKKENASNNRPNLTVYLASIKPDALFEALDNLTQLNVKNIVIYTSDYTNVKYDNSKLEKINTKLIQFCKQCERADLPVVNFISFKGLINELKNNNINIMAYENATENFLNIKIDSLDNKKIGLIVGGEGGFSNSEVEELSKLSKIVSLGKTILRAPVAATALTSAVLALMGEWHR